MKPTPRPQPRAPNIKHPRQRRQHHTHEAQHARRPRRPQPLVHAPRKQRERRAEQAAQHGVGRKRAGRVRAPVAVGQVGRDGEEERDEADPERDARGDGERPVVLRTRRPREPEQPERDGPGDEGEVGETSFRRGGGGGRGAEFGCVVRVDAVDERGAGGCDGHADADAEEGEAGDAWGPVAGFGEDDGVGGEVEVEDAVAEGHVEGEEEEDGFGEEHDPWPGEGDVVVDLGDNVDPAFSQTNTLLLKNHGRVSLRQ